MYEAGTPEEESLLFDEIGPAVRPQSDDLHDRFAPVAEWKTPGSKSRVAANSAEDVRVVTWMALSAPERLQHRVLVLLQGVHVPTASALGAVALPDRHTVFDVRSTEALRCLGFWDGKGGHLAYLEVCSSPDRRTPVDLRTLDHALWRWSKAGYPGR
jgi:hypothetical protein